MRSLKKTQLVALHLWGRESGLNVVAWSTIYIPIYDFDGTLIWEQGGRKLLTFSWWVASNKQEKFDYAQFQKKFPRKIPFRFLHRSRTTTKGTYIIYHTNFLWECALIISFFKKKIPCIWKRYQTIINKKDVISVVSVTWPRQNFILLE